MSQLLINQYLGDLDRLRRVSGANRESVVREAFKDLLKAWGRSHELQFIAEHTDDGSRSRYRISRQPVAEQLLCGVADGRRIDGRCFAAVGQIESDQATSHADLRRDDVGESPTQAGRVLQDPFDFCSFAKDRLPPTWARVCRWRGLQLDQVLENGADATG